MEQGVPPEIVRKQPASSIGMLWQRDILEGYTILIPRTLHMSLTVLAFLFYVLGIIPSWFLMKNPTAFLAAALSPIGLTGAYGV